MLCHSVRTPILVSECVQQFTFVRTCSGLRGDDLLPASLPSLLAHSSEGVCVQDCWLVLRLKFVRVAPCGSLEWLLLARLGG